MSDDPRQELYAITHRIVDQALWADESDGQYLDWDLVQQAFDTLVTLARRGSSAHGPSVDALELLSRATSALHLSLHGSPSSFSPAEIAGMEETLRMLQVWHHGDPGCSCPKES